MFLPSASPTRFYCCFFAEPVFMAFYICLPSSSRILFKDKERKWEEIEGKLQAEHDSLLLKSSNKVTACRVSHCVIFIFAKVHGACPLAMFSLSQMFMLHKTQLLTLINSGCSRFFSPVHYSAHSIIIGNATTSTFGLAWTPKADLPAV